MTPNLLKFVQLNFKLVDQDSRKCKRPVPTWKKQQNCCAFIGYLGFFCLANRNTSGINTTAVLIISKCLPMQFRVSCLLILAIDTVFMSIPVYRLILIQCSGSFLNETYTYSDCSRPKFRCRFGLKYDNNKIVSMS